MYYLFENNKICNIEKSKNDEENFSDEEFDKLVEQRHGKIKKRSENVFDLIEVGDLIKIFWKNKDYTYIRQVTSTTFQEKYGQIDVEGALGIDDDEIIEIYKLNKKGDYICVWRREHEEH